jgi:hypothetical protein
MNMKSIATDLNRAGRRCCWTGILLVVLATSAGCDSAKRDWEAAVAKGDRASYVAFAEKHPANTRTKDAKAAVERLDWGIVKSENNREAYARYQAQYPSGTFRSNAESGIDEIDWAEAAKTASVDAYRKYSAAHPTGTHIAEAGDEIAWAQATSADSMEAYRQYTVEHPQGKHTTEAATQVAALEPVKIKGKVMTCGIVGIFVRDGNGEYYWVDLGPQGRTTTRVIAFGNGVRQVDTHTVPIEAGGYMRTYWPNETLEITGVVRGTVSAVDLDVYPVVMEAAQQEGGVDKSCIPVLTTEGRRFKRLRVQSITEVK